MFHRRRGWQHKEHLFMADEYICPFCGASFPRPYNYCPRCEMELDGEDYDPAFVDEAEIMDIFFDD